MPDLGPDPGAGAPDGVRDIAGLFRSRAATADRNAARTGNALSSLARTVSTAVDAVRPEAVALHGKYLAVAEAAARVGRILDEYAAELDGLRLRARAVLSDAEDAWHNLRARRAEALNEASEFAFGWALPWDQVMPAWLYQSDESFLRRWQYAIDEFDHTRAVYRRLSAERAELDHRTRERLLGVRLFAELTDHWRMGDRGAVTAADAWAGDTTAITADGLAAVEDPTLVRRVWDSLTEEQQRALIAASPLVLGSLAGLPPWARVAANRLNAKARAEEIRGVLAREPHPYHPLKDAQIEKLEAELSYLEQAVAGRVQLYLYDQPTDSIIEMIGRLGPRTTEINTYVPGTYASALSVYRGEVQHVGRWLSTNGDGEMVSFVWKVGEFPGENEHTGGASILGIFEANDEEFALRKGAEIAAFQDELRIATREMKVDYNAIGHSWGLAGITSSEVAGARYDSVVSLSGAGMPEGWDPDEQTRYDHLAYTDLLSMGQATGLVWGGRNPGTDATFTSHIYAHEKDFTIVLPTQYSADGVVFDPIPGVEIPANWDAIGTHNLIASDDPANLAALKDVKAALQ